MKTPVSDLFWAGMWVKNSHFVIEKEEKKLSGATLFRNIQAACRGLRFISETDGDITPILSANSHDGELKEFVAEAVGEPVSHIKAQSADGFFDRLTQDRDWHGEVEKRTVERYRRLRELMLENITELTCFRAGRIQISIFVIGRDADGKIAGIRTTAVET